MKDGTTINGFEGWGSGTVWVGSNAVFTMEGGTFSNCNAGLYGSVVSLWEGIFNFYGGTKKIQNDQAGMILAYFIISGVTVQQILLHMKNIFVEFKNYPNIDITAKYIGSIIHYLTRDTFINNPTKLNSFLPLMNYYRNVHAQILPLDKLRIKLLAGAIFLYIIIFALLYYYLIYNSGTKILFA